MLYECSFMNAYMTVHLNNHLKFHLGCTLIYSCKFSAKLNLT